MSVQALSWVLKNSKSQGATRCVLFAIANHVGADGEGWAYVQQVMEEANCSQDTYARAVKWLVANGELERKVNKGSAMKAAVNRRPNHFRMVLVAPAESPPRNLQAPADCGSQEPQIADPKVAPPEPSLSLEPSKEPTKRRVGRKTPAHLLAERHWNETRPRPVLKGGFVALRNIIQKLMDAEHDDDAILAALSDTRSYTLDAIQFTLREHKGAKKNGHARTMANLKALAR